MYDLNRWPYTYIALMTLCSFHFVIMLHAHAAVLHHSHWSVGETLAKVLFHPLSRKFPLSLFHNSSSL